MAPRICKLCKHPRRVAIDKHIKQGGSFKDFRLKFKLRSIDTWCYSRHKKHVTDTIIETAPSPIPENALLDVKKLGDINKRLQILAHRSEKGGRPANAIQAYTQLAKNLTTLAEYNKEQQKMGTGNAAQPIFNICFKTSPNSLREEAPKPKLSDAIEEAREQNPEWDALRAQFDALHADVTDEEWRRIEFRERMDAILNKFEPRTRALFLYDYVNGLFERDLSARMAIVYRGMANELSQLVPFAEVVHPAPPTPVDLDAEQRHDERVEAERRQAQEAEDREVEEERRKRTPKTQTTLELWNELNGDKKPN